MNKKNEKDFEEWIRRMTLEELRILIIENINQTGLLKTFYNIAIDEYLRRII